MASLAQGYKSSPAYNGRAIQDYLRWLEEKALSGIVFEARGVRKCSFVSDRDLKEYFHIQSDRDRYRVESLVKAANLDRHYTDSIARSCSKVFTILTVIGYPHYILEFLRKDDLQDKALPFTSTKEKDFPRLEGGETFFVEFEERQYQYCVEKLSHSLDSVEFNPRRILPIKEIQEIAKGEGVSAVVRKIWVHEEYDDLQRPLDRQRSVEASIAPQDLHAYVVKTYHQEDGGRYFEAEVRAFSYLNEADKVRFAQNIIGFHKAFEQDETRNVILQYANVGSLEDYFSVVRPPRRKTHILNLWRQLACLNTALEAIHNRPTQEMDGSSGTSIFQGWHQDIKPENVLVRGDINKEPYNVEFFLADLGLMHFTNVALGKAGITGEDMPGARTYLSPEQNLNKIPLSLYRPESKQKQDIWALACVYSEFNTWMVGGMDGLKNYREARMAELNDTSLGPVFHGRAPEVSKTVIDHHRELVECSTKGDPITPIIWDKVLWQMFAERQVRPTASQLTGQMARMLQEIDNTPVKVTREHSKAQSPPHTPDQLPPNEDDDFQSSRPDGFPFTPPSGSSSKTRDSSWIRHSGVVAQSPDPLVSEERVSLAEYTAHDEGRPISQSTGLGFSLPETYPPLTVAQRGRRATDLQQQSLTLDHGPGQLHAITPGRVERSIPMSRTTLPNHHKQSTSVGGIEMEVEARMSESPSRVVSSTSGGKTRDDKVGKNHSPRETPDAPHLTVEELAAWAENTRSSKAQIAGLNVLPTRDLPLSKHPKEPDMLGTMRDRDHVFILDDSLSMLNYWDRMIALHKDLIYLIKKKKLDRNGSELQFITSNERKEKKDTRELVEMARQRGFRINGTTNFAKKIDFELKDYLSKLENNRKKKPISIYVMTDGVWETNYATKQKKDFHLEMTADSIARAVRKLDNLSAVREQIGIQFIRYGNDKLGKRRLRYLDAKLKKAKNLSRDICDTTPADGNVWKMMLGSISPEWDDDDSESEDDEEEMKDENA